MRISDWSSDVCSSDLRGGTDVEDHLVGGDLVDVDGARRRIGRELLCHHDVIGQMDRAARGVGGLRSEEHTSELQSLMRISYAVFCLKKKKTRNNHQHTTTTCTKNHTTANNRTIPTQKA